LFDAVAASASKGLAVGATELGLARSAGIAGFNAELDAPVAAASDHFATSRRAIVSTLGIAIVAGFVAFDHAISADGGVISGRRGIIHLGTANKTENKQRKEESLHVGANFYA